MCGSFISNGNSNQWQFKSIARYCSYVDFYAFLKNPAMPPFAAGFAAGLGFVGDLAFFFGEAFLLDLSFRACAGAAARGGSG